MDNILGICLNPKKTHYSQLTESHSSVAEMNSLYYKITPKGPVQIFSGFKFLSSALKVNSIPHRYGRELNYYSSVQTLLKESNVADIAELLKQAYMKQDELMCIYQVWKPYYHSSYTDALNYLTPIAFLHLEDYEDHIKWLKYLLLSRNVQFADVREIYD